MNDSTRFPAEPGDAADWAEHGLDGPDERPFTPPSPGAWPWLVALLSLGGAGLIGASVWGPLATVDALGSAASSLVTVVRTSIGSHDMSTLPVQDPPDPGVDLASSPHQAPVSRPLATEAETDVAPSAPAPRPVVRKCVRNGHTTFTDVPCPDGARDEALDLTVAARTEGAPGTVTLYRCRSHDGGFFWTRTHCHRQGSRVDRMAEVPAELSLVQQTRLAEQRRLQSQALANPPPAPRVRVTQGPSGARGMPSRCELIEQQIARVDSLTRLPQSGPRQDQLRAERRALRDEQFTLRCP